MNSINEYLKSLGYDPNDPKVKAQLAAAQKRIKQEEFLAVGYGVVGYGLKFVLLYSLFHFINKFW